MNMARCASALAGSRGLSTLSLVCFNASFYSHVFPLTPNLSQTYSLTKSKTEEIFLPKAKIKFNIKLILTETKAL